MHISIINTDNNIYSSSKALTILSYFLMDDIGTRKIESVINWLKDDEYESAVLNYSYIKKSNNMVNIYCFYDGYEREEHSEREVFVIEKAELIKLVQQWGQVCTTFEYVKIIKEGNSISLTGVWAKDRFNSEK